MISSLKHKRIPSLVTFMSNPMPYSLLRKNIHGHEESVFLLIFFISESNLLRNLAQILIYLLVFIINSVY